MTNPFLLCDAYKIDHGRQYKTGTQFVFSNLTPRKSRFHNDLRKVIGVEKGYLPADDSMVFFGLQHFLKTYLIDYFNDNFFRRDKTEAINEYKRIIKSVLGADLPSYKHLEDLHDLGYLPVKIKALPEGSRVPMRVPCLTIINTDERFFWLTNFLETILSTSLWQACTSATIAAEYRRILDGWAAKTGMHPDFVQWQGHDFSFRGMGSLESAVLSGMGHLLSFTGTDSIPAIVGLEQSYGANVEKELVGGSVPATEHSVMCCGELLGELATFDNLITNVYPKGIVSVVSDTWDLWRVCTEHLVTLKDKVMARDGKLVIRPDSGDPVDIICGTAQIMDVSKAEDLEDAKDWAADDLVDGVGTATPHGEAGDSEVTGFFRFKGTIYKIHIEIEWNRHDKQFYYIDGHRVISCEEAAQSPAEKGVVELLWDVFGGTTTSTGHRLLDSHIGVIYGDSITLARANEICQRLADKGFASQCVLGIGSYTYQYNTRDTFGLAMKATFAVIDGKGVEIFKDPITDDGMKKSAKGLLRVDKVDGAYKLTDQVSWISEAQGALETVFLNGKLTKEWTLAEVRANLKAA